MGIWLGFIVFLILFLLLLLLSILQSAEFYRREVRHGFFTFFRATSSSQSRRNTLVWGIVTIAIVFLFLLSVLYVTFISKPPSKDISSAANSVSSSSVESSSSFNINFNLEDIQVPEEIKVDESGTAKISGTAPLDMVQLVISNSEDNYVKRVMINEDGTFLFDYPIIFPTDLSQEVILYLCPTPVLNELDKEDQKQIKILPFF